MSMDVLLWMYPTSLTWFAFNHPELQKDHAAWMDVDGFPQRG